MKSKCSSYVVRQAGIGDAPCGVLKDNELPELQFMAGFALG
ncbi:MAG TPA: hypothetical protein VJ810_04005 [Blastocatellia bacterium]|nr:hypothetical protein [Blastocatellia bacterium]